MKDFSRQEIEATRPSIDTLVGINRCLNALYADTHKLTTDGIATNLTFEELLGILLLARDEIQEYRKGQEVDEF